MHNYPPVNRRFYLTSLPPVSCSIHYLKNRKYKLKDTAIIYLASNPYFLLQYYVNYIIIKNKLVLISTTYQCYGFSIFVSLY